MTKVGILTSRRGHCSHDLLLELESEPYYLDYAAEDDAVDGMGQRQGTPTLRHFDCRKGSKRIRKWATNHRHVVSSSLTAIVLDPESWCPVEAVQGRRPAGPSSNKRTGHPKFPSMAGLIVQKFNIPMTQSH